MNRPPSHLTVPTDIPADIARWQQRFESVLDERLPNAGQAPNRLHEAMRYSALGGGKRLRPVLVYASGRAVDAPLEQLDSLACAIELIHVYSLIHDDLPAMDDDDMRRGRASCHRAFDEATAILAGDALHSLAFEILSRELNAIDDSGLELIALISGACGSLGMAGGQALDLGAVGQQLDQDQLETMHRLKTGALIHASVTAPCLLVGADAQTIDPLSVYGRSVGLAFQVHDDILDVTGDSEILGKPSQADASLNKPTFPSILGLEKSRQQAIVLRDRALQALQSVDGDTTLLTWLADYVISRDR